MPLAPPVRRPAVAAAGLLLLVLGVAVVVTGGAPLPWLDTDLRAAVLGPGGGGGTARTVTRLGASVVAVPLLLLGALLLVPGGARDRLRGGAAVLAAYAAGMLLRWALRTLVARERPPVGEHVVHAGGASFPSGHTATATLVAGLLLALVVHRPRTWWRRPLLVLLALWPVAVGWSRVRLGVHWPSDVVGGWAFGVLWLGVLSLARGRPRWGPRRRARS